MFDLTGPTIAVFRVSNHLFFPDSGQCRQSQCRQPGAEKADSGFNIHSIQCNQNDDRYAENQCDSVQRQVNKAGRIGHTQII